MKNRLLSVSLFALAALCAAPRAFGQSGDVSISLIAPAVSNWNLGTNWQTTDNLNVVPGDNYPREVVSISNGGTSFLSAPAPFEVDGVLLGDGGAAFGTLEIRTGGSLELADATPGELNRDGGMFVGNEGTGYLKLLGGTLNANSLIVGGQSASTLTISGASHLNIFGNAILARTARVEGGAADINISGNAWILEKFQAKITGATHSPIKAPTGTANIAASLEIEFAGVSPELGDSWTLVDAQSVIGEFGSVSYTGATLDRGLSLVTDYDTAAGTVKAEIAQRLILNVHRGTGAASIENAIGTPIAIDGYTIASPQGSLNVALWSSLDDQNLGSFQEAAPTPNYLSELASSGSLNFNVGTNRPVGAPFDYVPTQFGVSGDDLVFEYTTATGEIETGIVEYSGPVNSLSLNINPATGAATVQNQSPFTVAIDGYTISSASGSLSVTGWSSLDDQNVLTWAEANPNATGLSELLPVGGYTLAPNATFTLGNLFALNGQQDLRLEFTLADGSYFEGYVTYGEETAGPLGDTNGDGVVDLDDLNNVRNRFGSTGLGDTDGDNDVDLDDLNNVRNNFGAGGSPSSVPEPSTIMLAAAGLIAFAGVRGRRAK